ncbi:MAG TPA: DnaD domain protein [Desulfosporosinus sp.]|nr:DnaD domain protein [Desulfosporosinus sp.]
MSWIESHQEVGRHPKTKKLARLLEVSVVTVVGHLHYLWWWALDFAQDGYIGKYDEFDIAEACLWVGDHQAFVEALLQSGFVDQTESGLLIHDWFEYAGRLITQKEIKREKTNERVKRFRNKSAKTCNADVTLCNAPTVPNLTVPDLTVHNPTVPKFNIINIIPREAEIVVSPPDSLRTLGTKAVEWAETNWGRIIPKGDADSIVAWCDEFLAKGSVEPDAVVIEGLKYCLEADVRNVKYLRAVLTDWRDSGILSVEKVKAREAQHISRKNHKRNKDPVGKLPLASSNKYDAFYL